MKPPSPFQGTTVQHLVLGSFSMLQSRIQSVAIACVTFALLMAAVSTFVTMRVQTIQDDIVRRANITEETLVERVNNWATNTSDVDIMLFAADPAARGLTFQSVPTAENAPMLYVLRTGPYLVFLLLFDLLVLFVAFVYFVVSFSDPFTSPADAAKRLPIMVGKAIGLCFWMILRSFLWIPIVGIIPACYFLPRFVLAPSLLASGDCTIRQSITVSMARTSGQWLAIVGRLLLLLAIVIAALWVSIVLAGVVSLFLLKVGFLLWLFALLTVIAYEAAYIVVLGAVLA